MFQHKGKETMNESLSLYVTRDLKLNIALAMELLTKIHVIAYHDVTKKEHDVMVDNILPADTDPATLKAERRDMRKSGFRPSLMKKYDCFAGIIIPHINRGGKISIETSTKEIVLESSDRAAIANSLDILSHCYRDKDDGTLSPELIEYSEKITRQTGYSESSNTHTILMAAKFLDRLLIKIIQVDSDINDVLDVKHLRKVVKKQCKEVKKGK